MPHLQAGDIKLYYENAGTGPKLLFINGTGADLRFRPNMYDGPLAKQFDLLGYDQRGLGRSEKPDRPYLMQEYADDAAALMDALGWKSAHVMGVSFGGMVAQELALRHPQRIERLVLACTSSGGAGGASYPLHQLQDMGAEERTAFILPISDTRCDAAWLAAHPDALRQQIELRLAADKIGAGDPDRHLAAMGARRQLEARITHDTYARLGGIRCKTLLCAGRYDGIAPLDNMRAMQQKIPGAGLEVFEGGHLFLLQDKSAYTAIIGFLLRE